MRCVEAQELLIQRELGELDPSLEGRLDRHCTVCAPCRRTASLSGSGDRHLAALRALPPELPQDDTTPGGFRSIISRIRAAKLLIKVAAGIAVVTAIALVAWRLLPDSSAPAQPPRPAPPVVVSQPSQRLPSDFLEQAKPGSGWVATAAIGTPEGRAVAYYYVESAPDERYRASIIVNHSDGSLTREIDLGAVSFGQLPFTQPEFRILRVGQNTLLGFAIDDETQTDSGLARLVVLAYQPQERRLIPVTFDQGEPTLSVSTWPMTTGVGIRTQSGTMSSEWRLTERWTFSRVSEAEAAAVLAPAVTVLAEATLSSPEGPVTVKLQGTMADGASLYLYKGNESGLQGIELGKPHFGSLSITNPALHKIRVGDRELLLLLSDPDISLAREALLRVYAYDPSRGQLRQIPFTNGEVLVEAIPQGDGDLLRTSRPKEQWRLSDRWLLEPVLD